MRRAQRAVLPIAAAGVLLAAGCGSQQNALEPHSRAARGIDSLWWDMLIGAALAFGIIVTILVTAWARRNRPGFPGVRDGDRAASVWFSFSGSPFRCWSLGALSLLGHLPDPRYDRPDCFGRRGRAADADVRVIGHQFWWEVRYPGTRP